MRDIKTKLKVWYSDETVGEYDSFKEAEEDILENVVGSNFNNSVDHIAAIDEDGNEVRQYAVKWKAQIVFV